MLSALVVVVGEDVHHFAGEVLCELGFPVTLAVGRTCGDAAEFRARVGGLLAIHQVDLIGGDYFRQVVQQRRNASLAGCDPPAPGTDRPRAEGLLAARIHVTNLGPRETSGLSAKYLGKYRLKRLSCRFLRLA